MFFHLLRLCQTCFIPKLTFLCTSFFFSVALFLFFFDFDLVFVTVTETHESFELYLDLEWELFHSLLLFLFILPLTSFYNISEVSFSLDFDLFYPSFSPSLFFVVPYRLIYFESNSIVFVFETVIFGTV